MERRVREWGTERGFSARWLDVHLVGARVEQHGFESNPCAGDGGDEELKQETR